MQTKNFPPLYLLISPTFKDKIEVDYEYKGDYVNERKRQVLLTAQRIFIEKGFASTSVQDILDESGISKGTFYNYFTSKNECLMAILDHGWDEAEVRRRELLIGQDRTDKNVLAKQIIVRMQVNHEKNLLPIFESIFHSNDPELRAFVKKMLLVEFTWLADRFVDIYGKEAEPYAADCAVLLIGMLHQMLRLRSRHAEKEIDVEALVQYVIRRIDSIVPDMIQSKDALLENGIFFELGAPKKEQSISKEELLEKLSGFLALLDDDGQPVNKQYVQFLLDELRSENPRIFVLESVVQSFRKAFVGTSHAPEAHELANDVWHQMDAIRKEETSK